MMKLKSALLEGIGTNLVFVSDRNASIAKAIKDIFPDAFHGICTYHLSLNIRAHFHKRADPIMPLYFVAAKEYLESDCNRLLLEIESCDKEIATYLIGVGLEKWTRAHSDQRRYNIMTTNIAECLNSVLKEMKVLPITLLVDHLRGMLQDWYYNHRNEASKMNCHLTNWAEGVVREKSIMSARWKVRPIDCHEFDVFDNDKNGHVNLHKKSCTCREFDLDQLPCGHAIAAASLRGISLNSLSSKYYTVECLMAAYAEPIYPVGRPAEWMLPTEVRDVILPPITRRAPARRQK
jgi:hypothetical protein